MRYTWSALLVVAAIVLFPLLASAELSYSSKIDLNIKKVQFVLKGMAKQTTRVSSDPSIVNQKGWKARISVYKSALDNALHEARKLDPPEKFEETHQTYLKSIQNVKEAVDLFDRSAKKDLDSDLLNRAIKKAEKGQKLMEKVTKKLKTRGRTGFDSQ